MTCQLLFALIRRRFGQALYIPFHGKPGYLVSDAGISSEKTWLRSLWRFLALCRCLRRETV